MSDDEPVDEAQGLPIPSVGTVLNVLWNGLLDKIMAILTP